MSDNPQSPKIAIVGVGCLFPGSSDLDGFWKDILAGRDRIGPVPRTHWLVEDYYDPDPKAPDKIYVDRGGFLDPIAFDPMKWGIPPSILPATDTTQLLSLVVAERALKDAFGEAMDGVDRDRVSIMLGVTSAQKLLGEMNSRLQRPIWAKALREMGLSEAQVEEACERIAGSYVPWQESTFPGVLGNVVAGRIANRLDLGGTNCVTDAACASAFGALSMAVAELALGHADVAICGGADTMNDPFMFECFAKTTALSKQGDCRPFDASADGTMLGEGIGMVVLERLEDAVRHGHSIYAVIRGVGTSSDGRAKSVYAPLPSGQAKALRRAYERAGYGPETVELVEAHGTGTAAGDAAELAALVEVFGEARSDSRWCALGSVKSQIGHTKAAAGSAGLIKAALALRHGVYPPTIKIERPAESIAKDGPFYASTKARPWIRGGDHPRRASVSSFGFGGSNFHVTLEEHTGEGLAPRVPTDDAHLVALSGSSAAELAGRVRAIAKDARGPGMLRWLAYDSQRAFDASAPARLALVAGDEEDLAGQLEMALPFLDRGEAFSAPGGLEIALGEADGPVAIVFPGQGSQYLEMGAALAARFAVARAVWDRADGVHRVVFPPPTFDASEREANERRLTETQHAQPAIGVTSAAALAVLRSLRLEASAYAGHSFGEVSALFAAGALSERDLLRVARERGRLMAEAAMHDGAMLAVSARIEDVRAIASEHGVIVANHNAPEQVVLSGASEAIAKAEAALRERRVRCSRLDVATAFHSPIVAGSREPFARFLDGVEVSALSAPVYANATAAPYRDVRETLAAQIAEPVRFVEQIEAMHDAGMRVFVEVGPGSVLTGLVGRILRGRPHRAIALDRKGAEGLRPFLGGLAKLAAAGVPLAFDALWSEERAPIDPRTIEAPRMTVAINGANVGKPYPPPEAGHSSARSDESSPSRSREGDGGRAAPGGASSARAQAGPSPSTGGASEAATRRDADAPRSPHPPARAGEGAPRARVEPRTHRDTAPERAPATATTAIEDSMGSRTVSPDLIHAFVETQRQTAEAHAAYQRAVADAHAAFLRTSEATMSAIAALLGAPAPLDAQAHAAPSSPRLQSSAHDPIAGAAPHAQRAPHRDPSASDAARDPHAPPSSPRHSAPPEPHPSASDARAREPHAAPPQPSPSRQSHPSAGDIDARGQREDTSEVDLVAAMMAVVAEKTGYPTDMLSPSMELEADLGVDSIKRVEILAALRERVPGLPELDPAELGKLRTLDEIAGLLRGAPTKSAPARDLTALMMQVVAEKTGYPTEMLTPAMELEADLGVDSIKRVEILAALRERAADLPELDPAELGKLRTLQEIADLLGGAPASKSPSAPSAGPSRDLTALMMQVVAEKTGYPAEMLTPAMELEADLGVDSIKRVEILAALRERAPELPELDPAELGKLRTLEEIAHVLGGANGSPHPKHAPVAPRAVDSGSNGRSPRKEPQSRAVDRSVVTLVAAPAPGLATPGLFGARLVAITDDGRGIADRLAAALLERGLRASKVARVPADADAVIVLDGLAPIERARDACKAALGAARDVADRFTREGGLFVTVQDTAGGLGLAPTDRTEFAALTGLAKTAAEEWPKATVRALDVDARDPALAAERIARELLEGGGALEVGIDASGARRVPRLTAASAPEPRAIHAPVVLASGGARGVTAACLIALARKAGGRFVLLGRSPLVDVPELSGAELKRALIEQARARGQAPSPKAIDAEVRAIEASREIRATLDALREAGADARYVAADVRDPDAIGAALAGARAAFGPFTMLVHGAGVLADRRIADKRDEDFDRVFATKVDGLRALLAATASDPLESIVLFSSVAARFGNAGQSDYAMANSVLDAIAAQLAPRVRARSIAWGPWEGGMVTPELAQHFASRGVSLIALDAGADAFVREALTDGPSAIVLGPALSAKKTEHRAEVHVSRRTHPYLADHAVKDAPVVPVVLAIDWIARAARGAEPELAVARVRDVAVLRGIPLARFDEGERLEIVLRRISNGHGATYAAELRDARGVCYRAEVDLLPELPAGAPARPAPADLEARSAPLYGGCLFHGERFRVIRRLEGVGEAGAAAILEGTIERGWEGGGWQTDPALLDGGLQLAVLWSERRLGGAALPTGLGELCLHRAGPIEGPVRALAYGHSAASGRAVCDVLFLDREGRPVAELRGVETHVRPGTAADARAR